MAAASLPSQSKTAWGWQIREHSFQLISLNHLTEQAFVIAADQLSAQLMSYELQKA